MDLYDGAPVRVGGISLPALHTPGHNPAHVSYLVTDRGCGADEPLALLSGDFVFVGDLGRPDLLETAAGIEGRAATAAQAPTLRRDARPEGCPPPATPR